MEPSSYINDWAPLDTVINSSSNSIHHHKPSQVAAYDHYLQHLLSMQLSAHAELELFRRLLVDGGATSSTPPFNMIPSPLLYPLSASPLSQLLSPSHFAQPSPSSSPKRSRDSNPLSHAIKEEEENKEGEEKGRKKVKSKVKKEELNNIEEEEEEGRKREDEGGAQGKGEGEKERDANSKKSSKKGGVYDSTNATIKRAKASSTKSAPLNEDVLPPPPPKTDFIHVRARRGQATDSHSLAERVRREKISERMRFLQDLVPGCSKITGKAMMLDEIINYVQSLQHQVEFLAMNLATLHPKHLDINSHDIFMEEEIASALAEMHGTCPDVVMEALEPECPYHMQMHDFPSFLNVRFCDEEDLPFISEVSTSSLI